MDYKAMWLIDNEVAFMGQYRELTVAEGANMIGDTSALMDSCDKEKVPVIVDATRITAKMHNIFETFKMFRETHSQKWGFTIVMGEKGITRMIAQFVLQVARIELRFAKDMDEALEILYRVMPELEGKPVNLP
jgi:hypothetical protein